MARFPVSGRRDDKARENSTRSQTESQAYSSDYDKRTAETKRKLSFKPSRAIDKILNGFMPWPLPRLLPDRRGP